MALKMIAVSHEETRTYAWNLQNVQVVVASVLRISYSAPLLLLKIVPYSITRKTTGKRDEEQIFKRRLDEVCTQIALPMGFRKSQGN